MGSSFLYLQILQLTSNKHLRMCISFAIVVSSSTEDSIIKERDELMVLFSHTGGPPTRRTAHFLKPIVASLEESSLKLPLLSPKSKWLVDLVFHGWQDQLSQWNKWVNEMFPKYHLLWRKVEIVEAILCSKCEFQRNDDLIFGLTERWNVETSTFVFP